MVGACIPDNMAYKKGGRFYINGKYLRRAFDDLYDIAKQSTLSPWLEQKPDYNIGRGGDRLEARWVYKKWALRLPNTLTELFATPEELIRYY